MEVEKSGFLARLRNHFSFEPKPFVKKRDINWKRIYFCGGVSLGLCIVGILVFAPSPEPTSEFHGAQEPGSTSSREASQERDPSIEAAVQLERSRGTVPRSLDHLYSSSSGSSAHDASTSSRSASMIVGRGSEDSRTHVPAGSRIAIQLVEKVTLAGSGMPVIGVVTRDFTHEETAALPKGSKVFGEASYDQNMDRARIDWKTIQMPDGRERPFSAVAVDQDGQLGVDGQVHSDAVKNTVGQTLTRFIGAYAEGSMERGAFGGNPGGSENGWKYAVAATAKDRADALAEGLKKERRWIEVPAGKEFYAVLREAFLFRDPGSLNGQ